MKLFLALCALFAISCNGDRNQTSEPGDLPRLGELREAMTAKKFELLALLDDDGFPGRSDCDLTLWLGEAAYAGIDVELDLVELAPGVIHRRPSPCWTKESGDLGARSTISNDMLAGYMLGRWREGNLEAFGRLATYGEAHKVYLPIPGWAMGEPYPHMAARVVMRPNGIGVVGRAIYALSDGQDSRSYRKWQPYYGSGADFERHVQAVGILTDGLVSEALRKRSLDAVADEQGPPGANLDLTMNEMEALESFIFLEPRNAFFQAVYGIYTGDMHVATDLLLDPETPVPSYVRGGPQRAYELIHWLLAAQIVSERFP